MKKITLNFKSKMFQYFFVVSFLALSIVGKSQCAANFTYEIGDDGTVSFTNISENSFGETIYTWYFGDGNYSNDESPINVYQYNGTYNIQLSMVDVISEEDSLLNCYDDTILSIEIENTDIAPICNPNFEYTIGDAGNVDFVSTSTFNGVTINYNWNFYDGSIGENSPNVSHTFLYNGSHYVYLGISTISDSGNYCQNSITQLVEITNATDSMSCQAAFEFTIQDDGLVSFNSISTGVYDNTGYHWYFGDGTYGSGSDVVHDYLFNGEYEVDLIVTGGFYCNSSTLDSVSITNASCYANADFYIYKDSLVDFVWYAAPSYASNVVSTTWTWGDGTTSDGYYPSHTYSEAGLYNICLIVTADCGSIDTTCISSDIFRLGGESNEFEMINISVIQNATAIADKSIEKQKFNLFPNPSNGEFSFDFENENLLSKYVDIKVSNLVGQVVYNAKKETAKGLISLNLTNLPKGTYFINAGNERVVYTSKIIIN